MNRVFIGSSSEGKEIAYKVISELKNKGIAPLPWFDCFKLDRSPLQELEQISLNIDGAILIGTLDDETIIRDQKHTQMRDNVLYEYGLFSGIIGRSKCGLIVPDKESFRIPTDFLGVACYKTYNINNVGSIISVTVDSLIEILTKPIIHESVKTRGRRLLQFIGWLRNESFHLAQDWRNGIGRDIISKRIIAVSGFINDDLIHFNLSNEYKYIEGAILDLIDTFPKDIKYQYYKKLISGLDILIDGFSPNPEILMQLFHYLDRRCIKLCGDCKFRNREHIHWITRLQKNFYHRYQPYSHYSNESICNCEAWAFGVAETITYLESTSNYYNPFSILEEWSNQFFPMLNNAIANFEHKLHAELFGNL
ncbi:MAG: hypothetical protein JWN78_490 [Bacteroidota bacterium]|nr:hypothetical protein [Bacteroidota bacterium]